MPLSQPDISRSGSPIEGAVVALDGVSYDVTLRTTADGTYGYWMQKSNAPLQVIVAADGFVPATKKAQIVAGQTTVYDFDLKPLDLVSARRARVVARPRQIAMYLAKRLTTRSLPEIGRKFGGRDHSTVIHAVRRIDELRDSDREIDSAVRLLMRDLEG